MPKPKTKRKKNPGVGVDFKKVKRKLGRSLPKADNETDTKVVVRRVALPGQSVAENRAGLATSSDRKLTLKVGRDEGGWLRNAAAGRHQRPPPLHPQELIAQLTHYAPRVRKDANSESTKSRDALSP